MSWETDLFASLEDLEGRAEDVFAAARELEVADRAAAEYAHVALASRLMASVEREVMLGVVGVGILRGELRRVGPDWCLLAAAGQEWVVRQAAVSTVVGGSERARPEAAWSPVDRLGLGSALRRLAGAGERCLLRTVDGAAHEAVLRRVGADFVETTDGRLVSFGALAAVQSRADPCG